MPILMAEKALVIFFSMPVVLGDGTRNLYIESFALGATNFIVDVPDGVCQKPYVIAGSSLEVSLRGWLDEEVSDLCGYVHVLGMSLII